jgi:hypothetical protein
VTYLLIWNEASAYHGIEGVFLKSQFYVVCVAYLETGSISQTWLPSSANLSIVAEVADRYKAETQKAIRAINVTTISRAEVLTKLSRMAAIVSNVTRMNDTVFYSALLVANGKAITSH